MFKSMISILLQNLAPQNLPWPLPGMKQFYVGFNALLKIFPLFSPRASCQRDGWNVTSSALYCRWILIIHKMVSENGTISCFVKAAQVGCCFYETCCCLLCHLFHVPEQDWGDTLLHKEPQQCVRQLRKQFTNSKEKAQRMEIFLSWISTTFQVRIPAWVH